MDVAKFLAQLEGLVPDDDIDSAERVEDRAIGTKVVDINVEEDFASAEVSICRGELWSMHFSRQ